MPKVNLDEAISIADPLLSDNFELVFPNLPAPVAAANAIESLRIQCRTAIKPGFTLEEVLVEVFGHTIRHAGRKTVSGSMSVEYVENSQMNVYTPLEQWSDACRSFQTQAGLLKAEYAVPATFRIFSQDGTTVVAEYEITGVWPKTVPDLNFDGQSAQAIPVAVEFSFDDVERRQ